MFIFPFQQLAACLLNDTLSFQNLSLQFQSSSILQFSFSNFSFASLSSKRLRNMYSLRIEIFFGIIFYRFLEYQYIHYNQKYFPICLFNFIFSSQNSLQILLQTFFHRQNQFDQIALIIGFDTGLLGCKYNYQLYIRHQQQVKIKGWSYKVYYSSGVIYNLQVVQNFLLPFKYLKLGYRSYGRFFLVFLSSCMTFNKFNFLSFFVKFLYLYPSFNILYTQLPLLWTILPCVFIVPYDN